MEIYVGNLNKKITKDSLEKLFNVFGSVLYSFIVYDKNRESKGYGFVTMENATEAGRAIDELDGILVAGQNIVVREADIQGGKNMINNSENSKMNETGSPQEYEKTSLKTVDEAKYSIHKSDNGLLTVKFN